MKKSLIANGINITVSILFLVVVFLLELNPLGLITAFIVTMTNVLLAIYSMSIQEYPVIKIGSVSGSAYFYNIATFILQILTVVAALTDSIWVSLICLFAVLVYLECISLFLKDLFRAMRFHIAVTLSVSFVTLLFYCLLRIYRDYAFQIPTIPLAIIFMGLYVFFMLREKDFLKLTAYSAMFSIAVLLLSLGKYASQNIYSTLLCIVGFTPVMFLLLLSAFYIEQTYKKAGVADISSVLKQVPVLGIGYIVGLLAILGFPPFSLFEGRLLALQSAVTSQNTIAIILLVAVFILSSYFLLTKTLPKLLGERNEALLMVKADKQSNVFIYVLLAIIVLMMILIPGFMESLASDARAYVLGVLS